MTGVKVFRHAESESGLQIFVRGPSRDLRVFRQQDARNGLKGRAQELSRGVFRTFARLLGALAAGEGARKGPRIC